MRATLKLKPNPAAGAPAPLVLDGDGLTLVSLKLDGAPVATDRYVATPDGLTIAQPPHRPFTLEIETLVDPSGQHPAHPGSTARAAPTAPSARPKASAASPISPTGRT